MPEETATVAIEYESAKVFETKASRVCGEILGDTRRYMEI